MKVKVKRYCDMDENERADYLVDRVVARPDRKIPLSAKSYNYPVPVSEATGRPTTEGVNPGQTSWKSTVPAPGVQNFTFFDVMSVIQVGHRGKLKMISERFGTDMSLSTTCDREIIEKIYGGYAEGFWQFKKQGDVYILITSGN
jgi:hypothetical protein